LTLDVDDEEEEATEGSEDDDDDDVVDDDDGEDHEDDVATGDVGEDDDPDQKPSSGYQVRKSNHCPFFTSQHQINITWTGSFPSCNATKACKLHIPQSLREKGVAICYHFETGLLGQCFNEDFTPPCRAKTVIGCHPYPQLAEGIFEIFPQPEELPLVVLPDGRRLDLEEIEANSRSADVDFEAFAADAVSALRDFSSNLVVVVGDTLDNVRQVVDKHLKEDKLPLGLLVKENAAANDERFVVDSLNEALYKVFNVENENVCDNTFRGDNLAYGLFDPVPAPPTPRSDCLLVEAVSRALDLGGEKERERFKASLAATLRRMGASPTLVRLAEDGHSFKVNDELTNFLASLEGHSGGRSAFSGLAARLRALHAAKRDAFVRALSRLMSFKEALAESAGLLVLNDPTKEEEEEAHSEEEDLSRDVTPEEEEKGGDDDGDDLISREGDAYCRLLAANEGCVNLNTGQTGETRGKSSSLLRRYSERDT